MKDSQRLPKTELDASACASDASARLPKDARVAVLTISDRCCQGMQVDRSGPALVELLKSAGAAEVATETLPDELEQIAAALRRHAAAGTDLIVTAGGTGLGARD